MGRSLYAKLAFGIDLGYDNDREYKIPAILRDGYDPSQDGEDDEDSSGGLSRLVITVIYVILMGAMMFVAWHLGNANGYRRGLVMGQLCNAQPEISACQGVR